MTRLPTQLAMLAIAALLSGCAAPVYEDRFRWTDGWREGVIEKIGKDERTERWYLQSCGDAAAAPAKRYASVRLSQTGKSKSWIVAMPEGSELRVGDAVYVNVSSCSARAVPRVHLQKSGQTN